MLAPLNSTMIVVALPAIIAGFHATLFEAGWLVIAYLLTMGALQPVGGKLGDRYGRRKLVLGGLLVFGAASLAASFAPTLGWLLVFRTLQAVAAAVTFPNANAALRAALPESSRASGFGLVSAGVNLAAAIGPPLGGILVLVGGWRSVFYANLPLVAAALVLGWRSIPRDVPKRKEAPFDLVGALLLSALLGTLAGALVLAGGRAGRPLQALLVIGLSALGIFFVRRELRHPDPVLQPRLFLVRPFASATVAVALSNFAMYSTLIAIPLLLAARGWRSSEIGFVLTSLSVGTAVVAPFGGRLGDRFGRRRPALAGMLVAASALGVLGAGGGVGNIPLLLVCLGVAGIGFGIGSPAVQTSAVESVAVGDAGVASGVYSSSRYLGSIVGSSLLASLLAPAAVFPVVAVAAALSAIAVLGLRGQPAPRIATEATA